MKVKRNVQTFSDSNICMFGRWIQNQNWYEVNTASDVQSKADAFYRLVNDAITIIFPVKSVTSHAADKPWITDRIKNLIDQRQRAFAQGDAENWEKLRNQVIREIKKAKINHNTNKVRKLQKLDPGRWHKEVRNLCNMRKAYTTIHVADVDPSNHKQIANEINEHLASFPNTQQPLDLADLPAYLPSPVPPPQVQQWDIYEDLKNISSTKAGGPDGIPPRLLKEFAYEFSQPLTDIVNASLSQGKVPSQWKDANVIPIPKKTPPFIDKLRPISLRGVECVHCSFLFPLVLGKM